VPSPMRIAPDTQSDWLVRKRITLEAFPACGDDHP
jgi:hypothetical protein